MAHERRTVTVRMTLEELHALYDAVGDHGRALAVTSPGEAATLWPFIVRLEEAWTAAAPKRRRRVRRDS
ncbi:hypothetical protein GCM10022200_05420 [Microbacterium awajiense]|uniref:Uncharacterized protein n=1 Tax=Microbacterium awajiense TaxID=415214 RepID=A0ABP7A6J8_9MICO